MSEERAETYNWEMIPIKQRKYTRKASSEQREQIAVITSSHLDEDTVIALSPDASKAALDDHLASVSAAPKGQVFVDYDDEGK